jgi:uncharacterized protein (TIGR04255 family)
MRRVVLGNKPLVEAIFELRWQLKEFAPEMRFDPHYSLLVGGLYQKLKKDYPFHEELMPLMPSTEYMAQHRFRKSKDEWPLVQIGPGIITVNATREYVWEDFQKRILIATKGLFDTYPGERNELETQSLTLRYIDAVPFDFEDNNILVFLKEMMSIDVGLNDKLFKKTGVEAAPRSLDLRLGFASKEPKGSMRVRFSRGRQEHGESLIWETIVTSISKDLPEIPEQMAIWLTKAHDLTDSWFFKLIEGKLFERFR